MLCILNDENQNILQIRTVQRKPIEFHKTIWKTLRKYFDKLEILNFIKNVNANKNNILFSIACGYTDQEIIELTWNEIKRFMNLEEQIEYLKIKGKDGKNFAESYMERKFKKEDFDWIKNLMFEYGLGDQLANIKSIV
ncbi:hypothetical protein ACKWTF_008622 [Chironomus riparius]